MRERVLRPADRAPFSLFFQFAVRGLGEVGVDEAVEVAVHDRLNVAGLIVRARILDELVGHEDIGADLASPFDLELHALEVADLLRVLLDLQLHELGFEHLHGVVAVLELAALRLAGGDDAGGDMNETHRRRGLFAFNASLYCFIKLLSSLMALL